MQPRSPEDVAPDGSGRGGDIPEVYRPAPRANRYTGGMFGYEPQKPDHQPGSWGETFAMIRAVLIELGRPLLFLVGIITLVMVTFVLFFTNPILVLLPIAVTAVIVWWLFRREQAAVDEALEDVRPRYK